MKGVIILSYGEVVDTINSSTGVSILNTAENISLSILFSSSETREK